jgi:hypothetical protein
MTYSRSQAGPKPVPAGPRIPSWDRLMGSKLPVWDRLLEVLLRVLLPLLP